MVVKYFFEDDWFGLFMFGVIQKIYASVRLDGKFGYFEGEVKDFGVVYIIVFVFIVVVINYVKFKCNKNEELINMFDFEIGLVLSRDFVIMVWMIGDEIEFVVKLKLQNLEIEYCVFIIMDIFGLGVDVIL